MMNILTRMLKLQEQLQVESYGHNFQRMLLADRIEYIKNMKLGLAAELQEALDEVSWKPWVTQKFINRDAYVGELVDVIHFWMNMLLVLGDDPDTIAAEIFTRYCLKNCINERRQREGYDGVSTKCGCCGRALDDVAVQCTRTGDQGYCAQREVDVNYLPPIKPTRDTVAS